MEATAAPTPIAAPAARPAARLPGPPLPVAVQTAIWSRQARRFLFACQDRYGNAFKLRIFHEGTWVILADPDAIKQVFTGDPRVFHAGEGNRILEPLLGPSSLLVLDEDAHMSQRKLLLPPFHGERLKAYGETMREIVEAEVRTWPRGVPYPLRPRMQALTLEIILRTVFGVSGGRGLGELRDALRDFLDLTTDPKQILPVVMLGPDRIRRLPWFRRRMDRVDALIAAEIAARRAADDLEERGDVLSLLVGARREDGGSAERVSEMAGDDERERAKRDPGGGMSDSEIRDELLTLLTAGHETTATALAWALERLSRHPAKLGRLREEVAAGEDAYLTATIQETLRLRPVISIVLRRLTEPVRIGDLELPAGVTVAPSVYLAHRNPEVYPDPEAFAPERFLAQPPGTYTWIPFGGGVRRCLGAAFAQFEMAIVLREIVSSFGIAPADPRPERVFRRAITETPRHNARVILS